MARRPARRPAGRHARTHNRTTPRRWLPFLLLIAVIGGAAAISRSVGDPEPPPLAVTSPATLLPVASQPDPVSSTWYCAGGTAVGSIGPAELAVRIANVHEEGAVAEVTVFGPSQAMKTARVEVPANGSTRVAASDVLPGDWAAMTVEVFGGRPTVEREVSGPSGFDIGPCSSTAAATWYVPSGSTLRGATEQLMFFNPFPADSSVDVRFATDEGPLAPSSLQRVSVPARSIRVVTIEVPARRREVAAIVTTRGGPVVVDRLQRYDGSGDAVAGEGDGAVSTDPPIGLVSTTAIQSPAPRWFFPEARKIAGGRTQVAIYNPSSRSAAIDVVVTYEDPSRYPELEPIQVTLGAGEETVVDLTDLVDIDIDIGFTIDVRSIEGVPVVAELIMFTAERVEARVGEESPDGEAGADETEGEAEGETPPADDDQEGTEGEAEGEATAAPGGAVPATFGPGVAVTAGSPVAAARWFLASSGASATRQSIVTVANPGPGPLVVSVRQLTGGALKAVPGATITIPAGDRRIIDLAGAEPGVPLVISAKGAIVVARLVTATEGGGLALSLATPFPESVVRLPPPS